MDNKAKIIEELSKQIEKDNELFNSLSNNEKKVVIAQDCIIRIQAQQFVPTPQSFLNSYDQLREHKSVKDSLNDPKLDIECEGCAKGGLFLALIGRTNKFDACDIKGSNNIDDPQHLKLLEVFTARELAYIEFAFEGKQYIKEEESWTELNNTPIVFTEDEKARARNFFRAYGGEYDEDGEDEFEPIDFEYYYDGGDAKTRLLAICHNIVNNGGEFIP